MTDLPPTAPRKVEATEGQKLRSVVGMNDPITTNTSRMGNPEQTRSPSPTNAEIREISVNAEEGSGFSLVLPLQVLPDLCVNAIVDTGANSSVISNGLAKTLGYRFLERDKIIVHGPQKEYFLAQLSLS